MLFRLLRQFPFKEHVDFAVWLAALLTAIGAPVIAGPVPGFPFVANKAGSGKGLLIDLIGIIAWGINIPTRSYPFDQAEMAKVKLSLGLAGIAMVHFDNLPEGGFYGAGELGFGRLTSCEVAGRILGCPKIADRCRCVQFGRSLEITSAPIAMRIVGGYLPGSTRRLNRRTRRRPGDLGSQAVCPRAPGRVIGCCSHHLAGSCHSGPSGGLEGGAWFVEQWDRIVRGAVWFVTGKDCLITQRAARDDSPDRLEKVALLQGWSELPNGQKSGYTVKEAIELVKDNPAKYETLDAVFTSITTKDGKTIDAVAIGRKFRGMKDQNHGGWILELVDTAHGGVCRWKVKKA